jgi:hypothetical protein
MILIPGDCIQPSRIKVAICPSIFRLQRHDLRPFFHPSVAGVGVHLRFVAVQ